MDDVVRAWSDVVRGRRTVLSHDKKSFMHCTQVGQVGSGARPTDLTQQSTTISMFRAKMHYRLIGFLLLLRLVLATANPTHSGCSRQSSLSGGATCSDSCDCLSNNCDGGTCGPPASTSGSGSGSSSTNPTHSGCSRQTKLSGGET